VPRTPRPPYITVADALRERLNGGEWLPGEALPSVTALAQAYAVSRSTAARAVKVLVGEGLLTVVPGWGTFRAER
jgi:GntR family transcriptional regulator